MNKNDLREKILNERLALSAEVIQSLSQTIQDKLVKSQFWPTQGSVGLYFPVRNEVMTQSLFQKALEQGLHVYFPRVEQGIKFYEVNGPEDLEKGSWSISEPKIHCSELEPDMKLDLLVVPGIVFSKSCYRVGYGRGFYDKFFSGLLEEVPTVSLAYDFQVVESIEQDIWDRPVKVVMTEKKIYMRETR